MPSPRITPTVASTFRRSPLALAIAGALGAGSAAAAPGDPLGAEFVVNVTTAGPQGAPGLLLTVNAIGGSNIAMAPDGRFVVVWAGDGVGDGAQAGSGSGVFMRLFDAAGNEVLGETLVNTTIAGDQQNPSVGMAADGRFVVAWDTSTTTVSARLFDASGVALTPELTVDSAITATDPDVAMDDDGDFIIAWERYGGPDSDIFFQRFDAAGAGVGAIAVLDDQPVDQVDPSVALDSDGDAVVAWVELNGTNAEIRYAQIAAGSSVPGGALTAETSPGDQFHPDVDMADNGDFAIVWAGESLLDTSVDFPGISMRRFQADGTPYDAADVQVNTTIPREQNRPDVALDADGDTVVTWTGFNAIDDFDVYFQRFAGPAGGLAAQGGETLITTPVVSAPPASPPFNQVQTAVTSDANGNFTVVWTDDGGDGNAEGVFSRRFEGPAAGAPPPPPPGPVELVLEATAKGLALGPLALAAAVVALLGSALRRRP